MKKKLAIGVSIVLLLLGGLKLSEEVFGIDILPEMPAITPRQKQLEYLKEHEQDIIDFVKAQNPKIESVQIDWELTQFNSPDMFTPGGAVDVYGRFNNIKDSGWGVMFTIEDGEVQLDSIMLGNDLRMGGLLYE